MTMDFNKYKPKLKSLLNNFGHDVSKSPIKCINPHHKDSSPSMILKDEYFKCCSCEAHGDIYDAIGLIRGLNSKKEQYNEIESIFEGNIRIYEPPKKRKEVELDPKSEKIIRNYIVKSGLKNEINIKKYLHQRKCTKSMIDSMFPLFGYWPGYEIAREKFDYQTLLTAGIGGKSWRSPGVVIKTGIGFKLLYYDNDGKSIKNCSIKGKTFPCPRLPDSDDIILVEGEMSANSMQYAGYYQTSSIGGVNGLNNDDLSLLNKYKTIYIVFDGDEAGIKSAKILCERLIENDFEGELFNVKLPEDKDPDDLIKEDKTELLASLIEKAVVYKKIKESQTNIETKNKFPFQFLGFDEESYYVMPRNQNIPLRIGRGDSQIKSKLLDIAPSSFWFDFFPVEQKNGKTGMNKDKAMSWFRRESQAKGLFSNNSLLGLGAHLDENKIVINLGDGLFLQEKNKKINYGLYTGKNFYCRSNLKIDISGNEWKIKESHELFHEILNYGFTRSLDYILLAGFITLAPFASILHRRPHLAIIGAKGCGKTTLIENIIRAAIGQTGLYVEGKTSEAGIRQSIGRDCRPTIIDEFESHNKEEEARNKNVLGLARSAYGGECEIIKGTIGQKPIIFKTKMMFLFASINIVFDNDADKSRIPVLHMKKSKEKIGKTFDFTGLRKRTFNNLKKIIKNTEKAKEYLYEKLNDSRKADTFGTLIGGFWSLVSDKPFMEENEEMIIFVENAINEIDNEEHFETYTDEENILNIILNHKIKVDSNTEKTVAEMLIEKPEASINNNLTFDNNLKQIGIRRDERLKISGDKYDCLAISSNNQYISNILRDTPFQNYKNILIRHQSVIFELPKIIHMTAGKKERCIIFDWKKIKSLYFDIKDENLPF